ncbi:hypothetical protein [Ottowia thiooxydans]|uniref:hypothetical protein n=1 Tax=Ottowia thiooxydans TaxID=219182 RepID=UPI000491236A|nr:hypothetical protein [Ottowia thiooxydans]
MQNLSYRYARGLQLDLELVTIDTPRQLQLLTSLAVETERTRAALHDHPLWGRQVDLPPRGFVPLADRKPTIPLADLLPWPALLTMGDCASNAAKQAGCTEHDVLLFACSICPYEQLATLANHISNSEGIADASRLLGPVIQGLKAKETRIKQGGSVGGKKSARTRQSNSKIPELLDLVHERKRLLESGKQAKDVASILAHRYGVHANSIRRVLNKA